MATRKIHPVLKGWIARRARDETELLMINFHDHLQIPRFPEPNTDEPRISSANKRALKLATALVQEIQDRRADHYKRFSAELRNAIKPECWRPSGWLIPS